MRGFRFIKGLVIVLPPGYIWLRLLNNLQVEWTTNPQYSYGWVVPLLCLGLLVRRGQAAREIGLPGPGRKSPRAALPILSLVFLCAFLYLPTRLIEAATPEWRPIQWLLGVEAIGLTLCAIYLAGGRARLSQLAFPICFFLVAIPWPSAIEIPIIQKLTQADASMVVEVMGILGVPAIQHGNLIEVGTGLLGIDEACSGIRSFQSSLMISLFLGEFYRLHWLVRLVLVPAGFCIAFAFNVCRTSVLTYVGARKGIAAVSEYHDPAGVAILLLCVAAMWGFVLVLKGRRQTNGDKDQRSDVEKQESAMEPSPAFRALLSPRGLAGGLLAWLVAVELGVFLWYQRIEAHLSTGPAWFLAFPEQNPSFRKVTMAAKTVDLLRFDDGKEGAWTESDGSQWHAFYFNWLPGRVAGYLAKRHTPEVCFGATGSRLCAGPELMLLNVRGVLLPVRQYLYENQGSLVHVFHCRWEAGAASDAYVQHESDRYNLIRGIWAGRGNHGQKVIEIVVTGYPDASQAKDALVRQLQTLLKIPQGVTRNSM